MLVPPPQRFEVENLEALDAWLEAAPATTAVYAIHPRGVEGQTGLSERAPAATPHLGKTGQLRRRLKRLLSPRERGTKLLHLRDLVRAIEYWPCGSRLESDLTLYNAVRQYEPDQEAKLLRLRYPSYVKLIDSNPFPRTSVTTRLSSTGLFYGPFRTRHGAEGFEQSMLNLFQLRRCEEDLMPNPEHPGCMYGEMNMCLRPCQEAVSVEEYRSEVTRVRSFLLDDGRHLLAATEANRDRCSAELLFEEAARQHKRWEQIQGALKQRDDLARNLETLNGVAITRSALPVGEGTADPQVTLWVLEAGAWQSRIDFPLAAHTAEPVSLDRRLKDSIAALPAGSKARVRDKQDHLALLTRWYHSSWRDGEWIAYESRDKLSFRKLTAAVARVYAAAGSTL
jgi:excinuclease ABC subunit C